MTDEGRFAGRVALVTGAGSGIGRATAIRLAAEGANLACLDVDASGLEATVGQITTAGSKGLTVVGLRCDVTDAEDVAAAFEGVEAAAGMPDVVCNVAGVGGFSHTHETTDEEWRRQIDVNLTGTFLVCRAAVRRWGAVLAENPKRYRRRRSATAAEVVPRPVIVNVASSAGLMGQPYSAAYCASKGGVVQLTRALAVEYLEAGFRVNAVAPGGVDTPLIQSFVPPPDSSDRLLGRIMSPFGFATPDDIAAVIAFVASEEAGPMTGAIVTADGGLTA
jgi:meso-butanediol dehydrogenase / (S,S)-butanediol dehydrogenase / diacetyl reductase